MDDVFVKGTEFRNIAGAATTVVSAVPCTLYAVVVNKAVATGVITLYDHASLADGTVIATITHPATLLAKNQYRQEYGVNTSVGLVVVTSTTDDITVIFKR